jgi:predicted ribonuclease YlaK
MTMKRLKIDHLLTYQPITENQRIAYEAFKEGDHLVLCGSAGTGKSFVGMYLALQDVLDKSYEQNKLVIVRSVVPTREMGYLQLRRSSHPIPHPTNLLPPNSSMRRWHTKI